MHYELAFNLRNALGRSVLQFLRSRKKDSSPFSILLSPFPSLRYECSAIVKKCECDRDHRAVGDDAAPLRTVSLPRQPPPARRLIAIDPWRVSVERSMRSDAALSGSSRTSMPVYVQGARNFRGVR